VPVAGQISFENLVLPVFLITSELPTIRKLSSGGSIELQSMGQTRLDAKLGGQSHVDAREHHVNDPDHSAPNRNRSKKQ
jgi:hypothetical protein